METHLEMNYKLAETVSRNKKHFQVVCADTGKPVGAKKDSRFAAYRDAKKRGYKYEKS